MKRREELFDLHFESVHLANDRIYMQRYIGSVDSFVKNSSDVWQEQVSKVCNEHFIAIV